MKLNKIKTAKPDSETQKETTLKQISSDQPYNFVQQYRSFVFQCEQLRQMRVIENLTKVTAYSERLKFYKKFLLKKEQLERIMDNLLGEYGLKLTLRLLEERAIERARRHYHSLFVSGSLKYLGKVCHLTGIFLADVKSNYEFDFQQWADLLMKKRLYFSQKESFCDKCKKHKVENEALAQDLQSEDDDYD